MTAEDLKKLYDAHNPKESWGNEAKRRGAEARLAGVPYVSCPYPGPGILSKTWQEAWMAEDNALRTGAAA